MAHVVTFQGRKYKLSGGYYKALAWGRGPSALHRAKWEHYRGPIPEGFDVHHKDGDGTNNKLSNLEVISRGKHRSQHMLERHAQGLMRPPGREALVKAAQWHASPEGLAWHSKNGRRAWDKRVWHKLECQECGRLFRSPYPNTAKFCHLNCKMAAFRRRHGYSERGRYVVTALTAKQRPD